MTHKILADLDKAVRVDLPALPVAEAPRPAGDEVPAAAPAPSRPRETSRSQRGRHVVVKAPVAKVEPAKGECSMSVGTYPWTELWIDGKDVGRQTPAVHFPLPCGKHKLRFKRDALQIDHVVEINLQPGREFKQSFDLASDDN